MSGERLIILEIPVLYRKRFIPFETVKLKDDEIICFEKNRIVTRWTTLKPRPDFSRGTSLYLINDGWKISKFFTAANELLYIYCDIIDVAPGLHKNEYIISDLLADVIVYKDNSVKVLDIGEIAQAFDDGIITGALVKKALTRLDRLLQLIYSGGLNELLNTFPDI
jgi:predicted RNA-binding protein associated with RNAse of E/G family